VLLATPAGERHEIGLLLVSLLALDAGLDVVNLGVDLPAAEVAAATAQAQARVVGLSVVGSQNRSRAVREIATIQRTLAADIELWLGGADAGRTAARVAGFRGMVVDHLSAAERELARVALRAGHPA
jgi:cobalamin-dependent methionine synthase I